MLTCAERASSNKQIIGAYVPQCDANGNYKVLQIHGSTGFRWCVDPLSGNELPGTRVGPTSKDPICDGGELQYVVLKCNIKTPVNSIKKFSVNNNSNNNNKMVS